MDNLLTFFLQNGIHLFNFAVLEPRKSGDGDCMKGGDRPRALAEVQKSLPWGFVTNKNGANVYLRPARFGLDGQPAAWPVVFLDDLSPAKAAGIAKKYRCATVETSFQNFQAWIITNQRLSEEQRFQAQTKLAHLIGADLKSISGEHFGRAPGYKNQKPERHGFTVKVAAINATSQTLDTAQHTDQPPECTPFPPEGGRVTLREAPGAGRAMLANTSSDESANEFRFALNRLSAGIDPEQIINSIANHALERGKRQTQAKAEAYARQTVLAAQKVAGG